MNRGTRFCRPLRHHSATWPKKRAYNRWMPQTAIAPHAPAASGVLCPEPSPAQRSLRANHRMADYAQQRTNMVDAQVRANDVTNPGIHAAMREVPRERFVPQSRRAMAYADAAVEVAPQRHLLDPRTFSKLLQLVEIRSSDTVLDVGCATGYSSAVLARLAKSVVALEQDADLVRVAVEALASAGVGNATVVQGQLAGGCKDRAPYDVIFVNGGIQEPPQALLAQLAEGGRLAGILQTGAQGHAELYVKQHGRVGARADFDASVPLLAGFKKAVGFVF